MQKGFISIPILIIALLGTTLVGGGGYTVYRINQIEKDNSSVLAEIQERLSQGESVVKELDVAATTYTQSTTTEDSNDAKEETEAAESVLALSEELSLEKEARAEAEAVAEKARASQAIAEAEVARIVQEQLSIKTEESVIIEPSGTLCNGAYWNECPSGQTFSCPRNGGKAACLLPQSGTNYYSKLLSNARQIIAINESFNDWLQDTSDELRDARQTLNGFPSGGLIGESREVKFNLVESQMQVISSIISYTSENISNWEGALDMLKADPSMFVGEETFKELATPDTEQKEIDSAKEDIDDVLNSVNEGIQAINVALWSL